MAVLFFYVCIILSFLTIIINLYFKNWKSLNISLKVLFYLKKKPSKILFITQNLYHDLSVFRLFLNHSFNNINRGWWCLSLMSLIIWIIRSMVKTFILFHWLNFNIFKHYYIICLLLLYLLWFTCISLFLAFSQHASHDPIKQNLIYIINKISKLQKIKYNKTFMIGPGFHDTHNN